MKPIINIEPHGAGYSANPEQRLAAEFQAYLGVCRGAGLRFDQTARKQVGAIDTLPRIVTEFERVGFRVCVAASLRAAIEGHVDEIRQRDATGVQRAEQAVVAARGIGFSLYPFQTEGVRWLAPRRSAVLGDEMGLGKTIELICSLPEECAVFVVAPANAKYNWRAEMLKWRPDLSVEVLEGRGSFRWPALGEVVVTNYDILAPVPEECVQEEDEGDDAFAARRAAISPMTVPAVPVFVIADEAHKIKNNKSLRNKRFRALARAAREAGGCNWGATGTPLLNQPPELWHILDAVNLAHAAFGSYPNFVRLFGGYNDGRTVRWGTPDASVADKLRHVMLVRRRRDVLPQLPTKTRQDILVPLPPDCIRLCDEVVRILEARGKNIADVQDAIEIQDVAFELISTVRAAVAAAMVEPALEIVQEYEEAGIPLLVFSAHTVGPEAIADRPGWVKITGSVSSQDRADIAARFQAGELRGIAGTIQAMGEALTLTHAHHVLFLDLLWTPALNSQAEDRVCRIGQTRGVIIKRMVGDHPICERVLQVMTDKQRIIEGSVDASAVAAGAANDVAARANAEHIQRATALASIFDSSAVVDPEEVAATREDRAAEQRSTRVAVFPARAAASDEERDLLAQATGWGATDLPASSIRGALAYYGQRTELNELEWAALRRMLEVA